MHISYNYVMSFSLVVINYGLSERGVLLIFYGLVVMGEKLIIYELIVVDDGSGFFQFVEINYVSEQHSTWHFSYHTIWITKLLKSLCTYMHICVCVCVSCVCVLCILCRHPAACSIALTYIMQSSPLCHHLAHSLSHPTDS